MERTLTIRANGISGWLSNGAMGYCTTAERRAVQDALLRLARRPSRFVDESWWQAFILRARTSDLLARVERELARPGLPPRAQARLERLRRSLGRE
jgi:hypothetical protein